MHDSRRSLIATAGIAAVIGAVVVGGLVRNRMEVGPGMSVGGPITVDNIAFTERGRPERADANPSPIGESAFFYQLTLLLEREFVDPVKHDESLAVGAIRGMVVWLADSHSVFYKPEQMSALTGRRAGLFEGIGAEVRMVYDQEQLSLLQNVGTEHGSMFAKPLGMPTPAVVVTTVVPGGPADEAGLRVGDRITRVNGKFALSFRDIEEIRRMRESMDAGEIPIDELRRMGNEWREKAEKSITAARAADLIMIGTDGTVELEWEGADGPGNSRIERGTTHLRAAVLQDGVLRLRFIQGAAAELRALDLPDGDLTIDLRNGTLGDYEEMRACLELLGRAGKYGTIARAQAGEPRTLTVTDGAAGARRYSLVVGPSTWGAAAVFAQALVSTGQAEIVEGELGPNLPWIELFALPDGSGYTLRTGTYTPASEAGR